MALRKIPTVDELLRRKFRKLALAPKLEHLAKNGKPNHAWFFDRYFRANLKQNCVLDLAEIKHRHGVPQSVEDRMEIFSLIVDSEKDKEILKSYLLPLDWIQPQTESPTLTPQEFNKVVLRLNDIGIEPLDAVGLLLKRVTSKAPRKRGRKPTKKHIALLALELSDSQTTLKWREIADEVCPEAAHRPHKHNSNCVTNLYREVNHLKKFMKDYDATHDLGKNPLIKSR